VLIALLLLVPLSVMTSCSEEDAPEFSHSINDLVGSWKWDTTESEDFTQFNVTISVVSDNKISIDNFANTSEAIEATLSEDRKSFTFAGELVDGNMIITNGKGTIGDSFETMTISFEYDLGDGPLSCSASVQKGIYAKKK
jgi:hypothetical protein